MCVPVRARNQSAILSRFFQEMLCKTQTLHVDLSVSRFCDADKAIDNLFKQADINKDLVLSRKEARNHWENFDSIETKEVSASSEYACACACVRGFDVVSIHVRFGFFWVST